VSRIVGLDGATQVGYDRLILAPGISLNYEALPGYSAAVSEQLPHAWQAGAQTEILRSQLEAMKNGGLVALSIPENPYRCPPGPYERASLIARYLKKHKPRSKILLLDAKDRFSKQNLFKAAWQSQFPGMIEWQGRADGATVVEIEAEPRTLKTDFDTVRPDVANVIPPQRAGDIALTSGLADSTGWCPVDALSFESKLASNIHVIGDAAILNAMPKSAFSANAQAKLCAVQVVRLLKDLAPLDATLANTCYSLINPDYGISVAGVYQAEGSRWVSQPGAGGASPNNVSYEFRRKEALYAKDWFNNITRQAFL
jgi:NADPH-dependent 2,4-dienoyl-CoA reductase/sulfur reductase-like enzyme